MNARTVRPAIRLTAGLALFALALTAHAENAALDAVEVRAGLSVACAAPRVPGFIDIGRIFDEPNAGAAYALRGKVQLLVTRACHSGAQRVLVSRGPALHGQPVNLMARLD